jgi:hypothetical protein
MKKNTCKKIKRACLCRLKSGKVKFLKAKFCKGRTK